MRGNVVDLAVGIIIGAAFTGIVNSLVNDVIMPPIGVLLGKCPTPKLAITIREKTASADPVTVKYGLFINTVLDFVIVAFCMFMVIKGMNRMEREDEEPPKQPTKKECPKCCSSIPIGATRCPQCTSELDAA